MSVIPFETQPDSLAYWMERYQQLAVQDTRTDAVARKIALHLERFVSFIKQTYNHDRISTCVQRDVRAWQTALQQQGFANTTVNNHLASLSGFATWVQAHNPHLFPKGNPVKGIGELALPPLEPRALSEDQVKSLKNLCDRLDTFYRLKGRRWAGQGQDAPLRARARPYRDKAIVFVLLSTGLRREELVQLSLDQIEPNTPPALQQVRKVRINRVRGKGKTERTVFLSKDARLALADYLGFGHPLDATEQTKALFLSAAGLPSRTADGRLSVRAINRILEQIGRWHDAEQTDPTRHISPLCPHDLRHTFGRPFGRLINASMDAIRHQRRISSPWRFNVPSHVGLVSFQGT